MEGNITVYGRRVKVGVEAEDMKLIDDLYSKRTSRCDDEGNGVTERKNGQPFEEEETRDPYPYPKVFHPNILPPTEFMALGFYMR